MSCYICLPETISCIAAAMAKKLTETQDYNSFKDDRAAFAGCFEQGRFIGDAGTYNEHKIYRKLYIENLKAYNGRYNENIREFTKYTPHRAADQRELHKMLHEYLYQISEDATMYSPIYNATQHLLYVTADDVLLSEW